MLNFADALNTVGGTLSNNAENAGVPSTALDHMPVALRIASTSPIQACPSSSDQRWFLEGGVSKPAIEMKYQPRFCCNPVTV